MSKYVVPVSFYAYSRVLVESDSFEDAEYMVAKMIRDLVINGKTIIESDACESEVEITESPFLLDDAPWCEFGCIEVNGENEEQK